MSSYIVKPKPDEDFYIYWSSVVDAPTMWGTRAEMAQALDRRGRDEGEPVRFARADETGTSSLDGFEDWDTTEFWVHNIGDKPFIVERENWRAFCESWDGAHAFDESLTKPLVFDD